MKVGRLRIGRTSDAMMHLKKEQLKRVCFEYLGRQWKVFRRNLLNGRLHYTNLDDLMEVAFMRQFNDMFQHERQNLEVRLSKVKYLYRAASGGEYTYDRLIPNPQYANLNRMNPQGELFLYLGYDDKRRRYNDQFSFAEQTCLYEIRAANGDIISMCEFSITEEARRKKVINLVQGINKSYDDLIFDLAIAEMRRNPVQYSRVLGRIYLKMIADEIFVPIENGQNRGHEYAPFHAFAHYFRAQGYAGIIYKSTVLDGGKNLVLFNPDDAGYVDGTMQHFVFSE